MKRIHKVAIMSLLCSHQTAAKKTMPSVAGIVYDKGGGIGCTGNHIFPGFILTAAHCVVGCYEGRDVFAYFEHPYGSWKLPITDRIVHPDFDPRTRVNDLAIVRFDDKGNQGDIEVSTFAQTIEPTGRYSTAGYIRNNVDPSSYDLLETSVTVLPDNDLHRIVASKGITFADMPLIGTQVKRIDHIGISGSPLFQNGRQIGVGMEGFGEYRDSDDPSSYQRTQAVYLLTCDFLDWVESVVNPSS